MAVMDCVHCGGMVSDKAAACPHCGGSVEATIEAREARRSTATGSVGNQESDSSSTPKRKTSISGNFMLILVLGILFAWAVIGTIVMSDSSESEYTVAPEHKKTKKAYAKKAKKAKKAAKKGKKGKAR